MLIIAHDTFVEEVAPLAAWKNQRGLRTTVEALTPIGRTPDDIKSYISSRYNTDGVAYVLLVGDDDQMPFYTYSGQAADPLYSLVAGSDSYPDLFVGRLSAETEEQVETQVERWIAYERDPQAGADWYHRACGIASDEDGGTGTADFVHMEAVRETLLGYTYTEVDTLYDPGVTDDMIRDAINDGRSLVNYLGHGSTMGWSTGTFINSDVNSLVNVDMLPWIVSVACRTGQFTDKTCFAEVWMRATDGGEPTGAVAIYASTVGMQWSVPLPALFEINHLLVTEEMRTAGGLCMNGACRMIEEYGWNGEAEFKSWHLFGDPSLVVRSDTPGATTASHAGYIDPRDAFFFVETEPGAVAALSHKGEYHGAATADGAGRATIEIVGRLPEDFVTLTVTRPNGMTLIQSLPIDDGTDVPESAHFALGQNAPNPFNPTTTIRYAVPPGASTVSLRVYDVTGRLVTTLVDGPVEPGEHTAVWDGTDAAGASVASGVYLYRYEAVGREATGRMVLLQ
jgi:gingipain R